MATLYPCDSNASWMFLAILRLSSSGIRCCRSSSQRPIVSSATVYPEGSVMIVTVIRLLPSRYTKVFPPTSTVKPSSLLILFRNQPPRLNILPSCRQIDNRSTVVSQSSIFHRTPGAYCRETPRLIRHHRSACSSGIESRRRLPYRVEYGPDLLCLQTQRSPGVFYQP